MVWLFTHLQAKDLWPQLGGPSSHSGHNPFFTWDVCHQHKGHQSLVVMEKPVLEFSWQMEHTQLIKSRDNSVLEVFNSILLLTGIPCYNNWGSTPGTHWGIITQIRRHLNPFPTPRLGLSLKTQKEQTQKLSRWFWSNFKVYHKNILDPCLTLVYFRTGVPWHYLPFTNVILYLSAR